MIPVEMHFLQIPWNWNVMITIILCHSRFSAVGAHALDLSTVQQGDIYIREPFPELLPAPEAYDKKTGTIGKSPPSRSPASLPDSILLLPK